MISKKEIIDKYIKQIEVGRMDKLGGQQVCYLNRNILLYCPNTGFRIEIGNYRSMRQNKEMALLMYTLYLEETL